MLRISMHISRVAKVICRGMPHERFHIRSLAGLRSEVARLGLRIPIDEDLSVLGDSVAVGGRVLPNRFAVQPMEGFDADPDGGPGPLSFRRYGRYARGGFGLIWVEATAVLAEARSNPNQLFLNGRSVKRFAALAEEIRQTARREHGRAPLLVIQLTHSGRYSKPHGVPEPLIAHHSAVLDPRHKLPPDYPLVGDDYLDSLQESYVAVAQLAADAGYDGVDVKSCHRYLVSELLASFTRDGKYGGSFENRTRFLVEVLTAIRDRVPGLFITTRMNAYDAIAYPYGFGVDREDLLKPDLSEPCRLVGMLRELGVPLLNVSVGNPYFNPHVGRPYDLPVQGLPAPDEHPLLGLDRFLAVTAHIQNAFPGLPIVASGYTWLRQFMPLVASAVIRQGGATLFGLGRGAFAYPDTPRDVLSRGAMDPERCCVACSGCTQIMRDGGRTGCVVRDHEVYGPEYRLARRFALDRLQEEARRCRDCETPTCRSNCPARVDVPTFVKAFAEGDIAAAYAVLRASNVMPEMCAYVCPAEVQCEGGCLEEIFCEHPIPIRDIQLVVCQLARNRGLTGVAPPERGSGRRVAVVGGGPAGVAATVRLIEKGHEVALYERGRSLGGTPDIVIPAYRYGDSRGEVDAMLGPAIEQGCLRVAFGRELGRDVSLDELRRDHDAVLLALGLQGVTVLGHGAGRIDALAFLRSAKDGTRTSAPSSVAVIGGGNTAMDAAVVARELGARDVYLVYRRSFAEMPAWPSERDRFLESGGHALILTQPIGFEQDGEGRLAGLRVVRTELGEPDASGRRRPVVTPDSESVLKVGLVVEAVGQEIPGGVRKALEGLAFDDRGLVATASDDSQATSLAGVYVAGDLANGGATAVRSIAEGMRAAAEIDAWLAAGGESRQKGS